MEDKKKKLIIWIAIAVVVIIAIVIVFVASRNKKHNSDQEELMNPQTGPTTPVDIINNPPASGPLQTINSGSSSGGSSGSGKPGILIPCKDKGVVNAGLSLISGGLLGNEPEIGKIALAVGAGIKVVQEKNGKIEVYKTTKKRGEFIGKVTKVECIDGYQWYRLYSSYLVPAGGVYFNK